MRPIRPIGGRDWSRDDAVSIGITVIILAITLAMGKIVYEQVTGTALEPGQLRDTCLGLWGCGAPSTVEAAVVAVLLVVLALLAVFMDI